MGDMTGFRFNVVTVFATFAIAITSAIAFLALGGDLPSFSSPYTVKAVLPEAGSLASAARVTMAGADVGRITNVQRDGRGSLVTIELTSKSVVPLLQDSKISLRERTPIGENYVSIAPGSSSSTLKSGSVVPMSQADEFVDVDQILSIMQGTTGRRTRALLQGLGGGLAGRGQQLNETLRGIADTFVPATNVVDTLYHDRNQVSQLVDDLGSLTAAIGQRNTSIGQLGNAGLTAMNAVASRDQQLRSLLQELPPTLSQVRKSVNTFAATSDRAAPVVANLATAIHDLRPAVQSLKPAADTGRNLLDELSAAAPPLTTVVDRLRGASSPAAKALPPVREVMCQVDPVLLYVKPYIKDLLQFMVGFGSSGNSYDSLVHLLRVTILLNRHDFVGAPPTVDAALQTLLKSGLVGSLTGATNYQPFPKPNMAGKGTSNGTAHIQTMDQLAQSGFKYRRLYPNCNPQGTGPLP